MTALGERAEFYPLPHVGPTVVVCFLFFVVASVLQLPNGKCCLGAFSAEPDSCVADAIVNAILSGVHFAAVHDLRRGISWKCFS